MRRRTVTLEKGFTYRKWRKRENEVMSHLSITPDFCPLNPNGWNEAPNPDCYELDVEGYKASVCCFWEGTIKVEGELYARCLCPRRKKIDTYERHEYKLVSTREVEEV